MPDLKFGISAVYMNTVVLFAFAYTETMLKFSIFAQTICLVTLFAVVGFEVGLTAEKRSVSIVGMTKTLVVLALYSIPLGVSFTYMSYWAMDGN